MAHGDWKDMFLGVQKNDHELVKYYINMGIDLNYQHPEYLTSALIESIRCQHVEMTELLLKNGASPTLNEAESNKSPLEIARESRNDKIIQIITQFAAKIHEKYHRE